jgi:hypothetical protein
MAIFTVMMLGACASDHNNDNSPVKPANEQMKDVTDKSACQGVTPAGVSIFNTWRQTWASPNFMNTIAFRIGNGTTVVTNTCTMPDGNSADVSITVRTQVQGNQFTILEDKEDTSSSVRGGSKLDCNISVKAIVIPFSFTGRCLTLQVNGQSHLLVP